jgi:hypothetical protein
VQTAETAIPVPHIAAPPAPTAPPRPLLEAIPPEVVEGARLPLPYRFAVPVPDDPRLSAQRTAADPEHGGAVMACTPFYKPVSRCVGGRT